MSDSPNNILSGTLLLIYVIFALSGVICIGISLAFYSKSDNFLSGVFANVGCSVLASAFVLYLTQRFTDRISDEVRKSNNADIEQTVFRTAHVLDAKIVNLTSLINESIVRTDRIGDYVIDSNFQKATSGTGIQRAYSAVSGEVDDKFLLSVQNLIIKLKDGKSFFPKRISIIQERARNKLKTTVVIFHPESEHLAAVASMDSNKTGEPLSQKRDSKEAITQMHKLRDRLAKEAIKVEDSIEFIGYSFVPTWVGFIGDEIAYVHFYFTTPYRGPLNTLCLSNDNSESTKNWYLSYRRDVSETIRQAKESPNWNLWRYVT